MKEPTKEQLNDPKWWDENAPKGSTHCYNNLKGPRCWEKWDGNDVYEWSGKSWKHFFKESQCIKSLRIPRPKLQATPWQGPQDGLPPVGYTQDDCACLFVEDGEFEILAHRDNEAVIYFKDKGSESWSVDLALPGQFRPIQSKLDKLLSTVHELVYEKLISVNKNIDGSIDLEHVVKVLYDAGMLVDPEHKPMSRAEARHVLLAKCQNPFASLWANEALDALGYKEPSQ